MNNKIKLPSNKSFGLVFFIVFLIIATWPIKNGEDLKIWSLITSCVFLVLGLMNSKFLYPLNIIWFKFGLMLGGIMAPLIMGLIYFLVITPTGLLMRMLGKDILKLKKNKLIHIGLKKRIMKQL